MKLAELQKTHECYDLDAMQRARDLFEGGERMRKNVKRHLLKNDLEPDDAYERRCKEAFYTNHAGSIGGYFGSFLFSRHPTFDSSNDFWNEFREDADGLRTTLVNFLRARFLEALAKRKAFWRIDFPAPATEVQSRADYEQQGLGRARLVAVQAENIIDWEVDEYRNYIWIREHRKSKSKAATGEPEKTLEQWIEWRADGTARQWATTYQGDQLGPNEDVPEVPPPYNPITGIPFVELCLPPDLWLMGHLMGQALEYFRLSVALSMLLKKTGYPMPILSLEDPRVLDTPMGAGYYITIGPKDKFEWAAPSSDPADSLEKSLARLKDEMYRIAQVMARGVENNAAAVGRSGESKQADDRSTEIVMAAYAALVRNALQSTVKLIATARQEEAPRIGGMEGYAVLDEASVVETAMTADALRIPSVTYKREVLKRVAAVQLSHLDDKTKAEIDKEIDDGVTPESIDDGGAPPAPPPPNPMMDGSRAMPMPPRSDKAA